MFILERRQNGKEIIQRITREEAEAIKGAQDNGSENVEVRKERFKVDTILCTSPEEVWWFRDKRAQASRGRYRCSGCFTVYPNGSECSICPRQNVNSMRSENDNPRLTEEQLDAELKRMAEIAMTYEGVKNNPTLLKRFTARIKNFFIPSPA